MIQIKYDDIFKNSIMYLIAQIEHSGTENVYWYSEYYTSNRIRLHISDSFIATGRFFKHFDNRRLQPKNLTEEYLEKVLLEIEENPNDIDIIILEALMMYAQVIREGKPPHIHKHKVFIRS